ncbi:MAG: hypothetical protein IIT58_00835 [Treponema sp.]|nr:hypothetical protein [Treponema sp.]
MSIIQAISDFFESIFKRNSPEVQKKLQMRKLESELRSYEPFIFKNGSLLPNFAEAIRLLYINTKTLNNLLESTIGGNDVPRSKRFEAQLVLTGFSPETQQIIDNLAYEERKKELYSKTSMTTSQIYDMQHKNLDKVLKELNTQTFAQIDKTLITLHQLADLCRFNFVTALQVFDPNFISADLRYQPSYKEIPVGQITNILEDLYYQMNGLVLTNSINNAVIALAKLKNNGGNLYDEESLTENLKKIAYVINHIISPEKLKLLICYAKADINYTPNSVSYKESAKKNFADMLQAKFKADEARIKTEMKNENIRAEVEILFGSQNLLSVNGYNEAINTKLASETQLAFLWILPIQILKTFVEAYLSSPIRSLLNDIVIEGFFNNPQFKSDFSDDIYAALNVSSTLEEFEHSFDKGQKYDVSHIEGYLRDSHNDPDFFKKLEMMINGINAEASKLITSQVHVLNVLNRHIEALLADSKKPNCEIISNLKVLMMSSRNRDNTDLLEQQYPRWSTFFDIMKNYAIMTA